MTGTNSTVDGLGFEESNQAVTSTEIISGTNVYGVNGYFGTSTVTTENITIGSIATIRSTNANFIGSINDATGGRLRSSLLGSATTNVYGGFIQTGSLLTSAGSQGVIKLGMPYSSATSYYVVATACGSATGFDQSYISGLRNASGADFVGAAELRYDWIAVGI